MSGAYSFRGFEEFYTEDDKDILSKMKEVYQNVITIQQSFWVQGSIDERFYAGDQSLWQDVYSSIPAHRRKQFNFNKIKRIVNMISGYQRKHRKTLNVVPIENSDEQTANQFSKLLVWANNQANVMDTISDAFLGSLITGMNLLNVWMDYREDPYSGDLRIENMAYNGYMIDPFFKKLDMSDCNYVWVRKFLSKKQIISLMPEREKEIEKMQGYQSRDGYFNFQAENYNINLKNLLPYDEYWYLDFRDATILLDPQNEESMEWEGPEENLRLFLKRYPQIKSKKIKKQTVKLAIVVNNRVFYHGANPYKIDKYPFVPVVGYYQPELPYYEWRLQGVVRSLRDSQFLLNRRQQIILDILESQINSGLKVMENSLVDDKDAFKAGQGQVLFIKQDAPQGMGSVEKIPPGQVGPGMLEMVNQLNQDIMDISGVNEELLGSAEDDKAGILSMLRQGAGLTTLQILFDHLDSALKNVGRLEMDLIQANFSPAKVARVIEEQPSQQFYDKNFQKYDCQVVEGIDTPTQKMQAFKQALYLRETGVPIPTSFLLEMSTLQNKGKLVQEIAQQEQEQQQIQQMQNQLQMQELEARTNLANARAQADQGLAIERTSRVNENESLAISRRSQAALDEVRAAKELQGMDVTQLQGLIDVLERIKNLQDVEGEKLNPVKTGQPQETVEEEQVG